MSAEPPVQDPAMTTQLIVHFRQVLEPVYTRYKSFARAHALRYGTGRFWLDHSSNVMFTARDAGPDIEVIPSTTHVFGAGPESYRIEFAHAQHSLSALVPPESTTVCELLSTLIERGLELESHLKRRKPHQHLHRHSR